MVSVDAGRAFLSAWAELRSDHGVPLITLRVLFCIFISSSRGENLFLLLQILEAKVLCRLLYYILARILKFDPAVEQILSAFFYILFLLKWANRLMLPSCIWAPAAIFQPHLLPVLAPQGKPLSLDLPLSWILLSSQPGKGAASRGRGCSITHRRLSRRERAAVCLE